MRYPKFLLSICLLFNSLMFANPTKVSDPNEVIQQMVVEISAARKIFAIQQNFIQNKITTINAKLKKDISTNEKLDLLIEKDQLKDNLIALKNEINSDVSKIRYLKGLQIIKILYEKTLSLDHHFSSVRTFSDINKLANPNQYPEFDKLKALIKEKEDKKSGFDLTSLLAGNPIVSVVNTFSNLLVSNLSKEDKNKELANVDCILDFTMRMQNDLNTIYFETSFLQASNQKIKEDIEILFKDYTKPIGYANTLESCRNNDDWDNLSQKMGDYLTKQKTATPSDQQKMTINMEFPIDRLIQFIGQYNDFIDQGEKFYQKFKIILNSYENQKQCESKIPLEYGKLKADVEVAITKFNTAYKPVEINGSKMKELLYGINEFE